MKKRNCMAMAAVCCMVVVGVVGADVKGPSPNGETARLVLVAPDGVECINAEECGLFELEVWVKDMDPADTEVNGTQFYLEWDPGCIDILDVIPNEAFGDEIMIEMIEIINNVEGRLDYRMASLDYPQTPVNGEVLLAVIQIQPDCQAEECYPGIRFREFGPGNLPNKVSIPGGAIEYPGWLTLDPAIGSELNLGWDLKPPIFTECPDDQDLVNTNPDECGVHYTLPVVEVTDNVDTAVDIVCERSDGADCTDDYYPVGDPVTVTWTATDDCGNVAICQMTIEVVDDGPPQFLNCPENGIQADSDGVNCGAAVDLPVPNVVGAHGDVVVTIEPPLVGGIFPVGETTVTWTALDACENEAMCVFTVTVVDAHPPVLTCPEDILDVPADPGECQAMVSITYPECDDACGCSIAYCRSDFEDLEAPFPVGETIITWYAYDGTHVTDCQQTITVVDTQAPELTCPQDLEESAGEDCAAIIQIESATCEDNCGDGCASIVGTRSDGLPLSDPYPVGDTTITWNAVDVNGNDAAPCAQTITVNDNGDPWFVDDPEDITTNAEEGVCYRVIPEAFEITAADECDDAVQITFEIDGNPADATYQFPVGQTIVTVTAEDASGNSISTTFSVTVIDDQDPDLDDVDDIVLTMDANTCGAEMTDAMWTVGIPTDNCDIDSMVCTLDEASSVEVGPGMFFEAGTTGVSCVATDVHSNTTTIHFNVIVNDTLAPEIMMPVDIVVPNDEGECSAVVEWSEPGFYDNCELSSYSCDYESGETFEVGTTIVTCSACDVHGNCTSNSFSITVEDLEPPHFTEFPDDLIWYAELGSDEAIIPICESECRDCKDEDCAFYEPVCHDNCEPCFSCNPMAIRSDNLPLSAPFPVGDTIITWFCTDPAGNPNTQDQLITVKHGFNVDIDTTIVQGFVNDHDHAVVRPIEFVLQTEAKGEMVHCELIPFDNPPAAFSVADYFVEIPPYSGGPEKVTYDCLVARDRLHSLARAIPIGVTEAGPVPPKFMFTIPEGKELVMGNFNADLYVDVEDFGIFKPQWDSYQSNPSMDYPSPTCEWDVFADGFHVDMDGDESIDGQGLSPRDFVSLAAALGPMYYGVVSESCNPGKALAVDGPRDSIPVKELMRKYGRETRSADINRDGVVDRVDIEMFFNGEEPQDSHNDWHSNKR